MSAELVSGYGQIVLTAAGLVALFAAACLAPVLVRVFLFAQVVYWTLSFVLRPVVLLTSLPVPKFADSIADPRLAYTGYSYSIAHVLHPIAISVWIYVLIVLAFILVGRRLRGANPAARTDARAHTFPSVANPNLLPTFAVAYVIGTAGRAASYLSGSAGQAGDVTSANPYLDLVSGFAGLAAIGLILYIRLDRTAATVAVIGALLAGELVWGILVESKTPLLGAALAIAIRFAMEGYSRTKVIYTGVGGVVLLAAFGWLQSFKVSADTALASASADSGYPAVVKPLLSVIRRFDLLEASTDVWYFSGRTWITPEFTIKNMILNLIPSQLGVTKFQSGTEWAQTVRGSSVDMRGVSVSLAEGHLNEGLLIGGYTGVIAESVFVLALIWLTAHFLRSSHILLIIPALGFIAFPSLFERGALGITETLGKVVQFAVAMFLLQLAVAWYRRRAGVADEPASRTPPPTAILSTVKSSA